MADKILRYKTGSSPLKMVDNGDGTYSIATTLMNKDGNSTVGGTTFPEPIKVPSEYMKPEIIDKAGYPLYVDDDGTLYGDNSGQLWSTKDGETFVNHMTASSLESDLTRFDSMTITSSGKIILVVRKSVHQGGQIWMGDSLDGTFTKVLENTVGDGFIDAAFRQANFWHHKGFAKDILLAGTYGQTALSGEGKANRVYLSLDEGENWDLIFESPVRGTQKNRHIHSVAYDPYYAWIWVTYGDAESAGISYSPDLGATWVHLSETHQPTTSLPLQRNVAFGSDDPFHVGIYSWKRPETAGTIASIPKGITQTWHKLHAYGTSMIARRGVIVDSQHAAMLFASSTTTTGEIVVVTGDGGQSWHPVWTAEVRSGDNGFTNAGPNGEFYYNIGKGKIAKFKLPQFYDSTRIVTK